MIVTIQRDEPIAVITLNRPDVLNAINASMLHELAGTLTALKGDDSWHEFRIEAAADTSWSVRTSHRAGTRNIVPVICDTLGLLAYDGEANLLIWPRQSV